MKAVNYKDEDSAAWKRMLICTFVVLMLSSDDWRSNQHVFR